MKALTESQVRVVASAQSWIEGEAVRHLYATANLVGMQQLVQTPLGGRVVCEDRNLLYEEAPSAYKNIESVIADLVAAGLVSVIATLRPLFTYKTHKLRR